MPQLSFSTSFFCPPPSLSLSLSLSASSPPARSPALPQEQFEAVWTAFGYWQLQTVVAHSPDDSGGVHILIGHLSCQHLPQHDAEGPAENKRDVAFTFRHDNKDVKWTDERKHGWNVTLSTFMWILILRTVQSDGSFNHVKSFWCW